METESDPAALFHRYQELQSYVGWTEADAVRIRSIGAVLEPHFVEMIDDFYAEIERHPNARKVITGGQPQIARLKGTLLTWIRELFAGQYDAAYVIRRWKVGRRHVEIGLDQVYTNMALSRLRNGMIRTLQENWQGEREELHATLRSLNALIDLDLAKIEDAYQAEYLARQQRVERLAAIGQVAGGIAHELRNPLNVVKTSVYFLLNARNATAEKRAEHLQRIERHVVLADGVITALTNFARLPVPNMRAFPLVRCVQEALEITPMPENCRSLVDIPGDLPQVLADLDQIRIVFANLARNAREAMTQGGQLTITSHSANGWVEVIFADSGTGISPEHLPRVMEPLYSTKARGLGLGLAIARSILDKNNGSMRVASELGKGTTFTVRLTAAIEQEEART